MLRAERVSVHFGGVRAVDEVDAEVLAGEVLGLVGPNGSGKTTLLNAVCGVVPAKGRLVVDGRPVTLGRPRAARSAGIARVFQAPQVFEDLSVLENVLVSSRDDAARGLTAAWLLRPRMWAHERRRWQTAMDALEMVGLSHLAEEKSRQLTYGQRRLLELARALAAQPAVLLLDEPSAGLNSAETQGLAALLTSVRRVVPAIAVVDHKIDFLDAVCDRLMVLELGRVIANGPPDTVWQDKRVIEAYLGVSSDARD